MVGQIWSAGRQFDIPTLNNRFFEGVAMSIKQNGIFDITIMGSLRFVYILEVMSTFIFWSTPAWLSGEPFVLHNSPNFYALSLSRSITSEYSILFVTSHCKFTLGIYTRPFNCVRHPVEILGILVSHSQSPHFTTGWISFFNGCSQKHGVTEICEAHLFFPWSVIQFYCFLKYTNERKGILNCIKFIANMYYHRRKRHADMPPTDFHYDTKTKRMGVGPYVNCKGCFAQIVRPCGMTLTNMRINTTMLIKLPKSRRKWKEANVIAFSEWKSVVQIFENELVVDGGSIGNPCSEAEAQKYHR